MNAVFYLAIDRLPLATVASIEFVATIAVALVGVRSLRNLVALAVALVGVYALIGFAGVADCSALAFAAAQRRRSSRSTSCSAMPSARSGGGSSIDRLAAAMLVALVFAAPFGIARRVRAFVSPMLLLAGHRRRDHPPPSFPMSATSSPWRGCRARLSR